MTSWIFLRGLARESGHWGRFIDEFRRRRPNDAVTPVDIAGNGELFGETSPIRIEDMVSQVRRDVARKRPALPVHLVGLSMGGMIASRWAVEWPEEVKSTVLINTSMRPFGSFYQRLRPRNYLSLAKTLLPFTSRRQREQVILELTSATRPGQVVNDWVQLHESHPVSGLNAIRQLMAAGRYRAPKDPPSTPVLVLASQNDQLVSHECSLLLARHWNSELRVHPWAGHDLPLDDAPWVIDQILGWSPVQKS